MEKSIFKLTPSQHEATVTFMHNYIDTMVAEGNITPYTADDMHLSINQYKSQNKGLALEAFCAGINAHISKELESSLENSSSVKP